MLLSVSYLVSFFPGRGLSGKRRRDGLPVLIMRAACAAALFVSQSGVYQCWSLEWLFSSCIPPTLGNGSAFECLFFFLAKMKTSLYRSLSLSLSFSLPRSLRLPLCLTHTRTHLYFDRSLALYVEK